MTFNFTGDNGHQLAITTIPGTAVPGVQVEVADGHGADGLYATVWLRREHAERLLDRTGDGCPFAHTGFTGDRLTTTPIEGGHRFTATHHEDRVPLSVDVPHEVMEQVRAELEAVFGIAPAEPQQPVPAVVSEPSAPAGPGLSWARQLPYGHLATFLNDLGSAAISHGDLHTALAEVERVLNTWTLTALAAGAGTEQPADRLEAARVQLGAAAIVVMYPADETGQYDMRLRNKGVPPSHLVKGLSSFTRALINNVLDSADEPAAAEDPICGDQYDDMVCVLEPGHDGHHYDDSAITEWADAEAGEGQ
ncbi:hypothetical protein [Streptomyces sp. NPDC002644]